MKKIVFLASLLMSLVATAAGSAWAGGATNEGVCSAKFQACEESCKEDVVCQLHCWEDKDGCSLKAATYKEPKPTVGVMPYSVQLTVRFF